MNKGKVAVITGAGGLIGSSCVAYFSEHFDRVVGVDNDMRAYFFGEEGSTQPSINVLADRYANFENHYTDIRNREKVEQLFNTYGADIELVIHTAAQPSHDWAAKEPNTDFEVNALGTHYLLEATKKYAPKATFIFTSTNKVYGDTPNRLPLEETGTRYELPKDHIFHKGINETMSIDQSMHSLFGVSKLAADIMVQEYGRYFGLRTTVFRGGCLTGPNHASAELHGFLSYLAKCAKEDNPYTIFGYKGKQVRDNIHSEDLVRAFHAVHENPKIGAVYNIGGGRQSNCSILEAITILEDRLGKKMSIQYADEHRKGDHQWYITDNSKFQNDYPDWEMKHNITSIIADLCDAP